LPNMTFSSIALKHNRSRSCKKCWYTNVTVTFLYLEIIVYPKRLCLTDGSFTQHQQQTLRRCCFLFLILPDVVVDSKFAEVLLVSRKVLRNKRNHRGGKCRSSVLNLMNGLSLILQRVLLAFQSISGKRIPDDPFVDDLYVHIQHHDHWINNSGKVYPSTLNNSEYFKDFHEVVESRS
jgi:hypothetical protein